MADRQIIWKNMNTEGKTFAGKSVGTIKGVYTIHLKVDAAHQAVKAIKGISLSTANQIVNTLMELSAKNESGKFTIGFGKYKGQTLMQIQNEDPGYLTWMKQRLTEDPDPKFNTVREAIEAFI